MVYLKKHKHLIFLLVAGFILKLVFIQMPILEPVNSPTRQALTATTARNFYYNGFNFFKPQLDNNGKQSDYYLVGTPFYSYISGLGYILFKPNTWFPRLVSIIFSLGTIFFLYHLVLLFYEKQIAILTAVLFTLSPMSIAISRSIQPDAMMVFFMVLSIYAFTRYIRQMTLGFLIIASMAMIVSIGMKILSVYFVLPMLYLLWTKHKLSFFKSTGFYAIVISVAIAFSWYIYIYYLARSNPTIKYNIFAGKQEFYSFINNLFTVSFIVNISKSFTIYVLTPLGVILSFLGLVKKKALNETFLFHFWLLGLIGYLIIFSGPNMNHHYYQYPFLLPLSVFAAKGIILLRDSKIFSQSYLNNGIGITLSAITVTVMLLVVYTRIYTIPKSAKNIVEAGDRVNEIVPQNALVVAAYGSGPVFLYYTNRKGWEFMIHRELLPTAYKRQNAELPKSFDSSPIKYLEKLRNEGAQYFAAADVNSLNAHKAFSLYLRNNFNLLDQIEGKYVIYDIREKLKSQVQ
jgi:4-amino-4-deoxy-L-arabinose transferase-like glycosyltransferase